MNRRISALTSTGRTLDGGVMFGDTPRNHWAEWISPDNDNKVKLASRALLVQEAGQNILVLAGSEALLAPLPRTCGCQKRARGLLDALAEQGLGEDDIHIVVLGHLHARLSARQTVAVQNGETPRLLFANARYLIGERHWFRARHPHPRDRALFVAQILNLLQASNRIELLMEAHSTLLGNGWQFHFSDGYTPGQLLPEIAMPGGPVLFAGDLIPGSHWLELAVTSGYDRNPECVVGEKERLLDHLVSERGRVFFCRDPDVAMVKVMRDRQSRYLAYDLYRALSRFES
ncbi:glyoxylase-like metal-dependent hydrolase (beta-lactamase superfamily II) [Pseudomonas laurylsulfativorans]|uniref:MBL fold metallo-hydrolase n=1 Tax=Pseudomonas laurylsulfativorans TaxID=1943631 RepID=UPI00209EAFAC|nr:MBL fold metallo-hydrolase [Pseudomonas laurylsulfativorans]MCP1419116.1 glyoxylase-like metal-dependent hydrolase (beta-lactamase superfamily II) [Pseudomonas laurylsulfativorans]